jgi:hypothetical protein
MIERTEYPKGLVAVLVPVAPGTPEDALAETLDEARG